MMVCSHLTTPKAEGKRTYLTGLLNEGVLTTAQSINAEVTFNSDITMTESNISLPADIQRLFDPVPFSHIKCHGLSSDRTDIEIGGQAHNILLPCAR